MTALQRIVKYCAVAFAVFLIVAIISGICGAISMVSFFFDGDAAGEMQTYTVSSDVESLARRRWRSSPATAFRWKAITNIFR